MDKIIINVDEAKKNSMKELLSKLSSNKNGLSVQEANQRLQKYGPNEIIEKKQILLLNLLDIFGVLYHGLLK